MSLQSMDTTQLLDLFHVGDAAPGKGGGGGGGGAGGAGGVTDAMGGDGVAGKGKKDGLKAMLNGLEELWDDSQYKEEFELEGFRDKLN
jgi:TATA-binding protein-associated factor